MSLTGDDMVGVVRNTIALLERFDLVGIGFNSEVQARLRELRDPEFGNELRARLVGADLVRELHTPVMSIALCRECGSRTPCPTLQAITPIQSRRGS